MDNSFYHIHKKKYDDIIWNVGNIIEFGKEDNFFWKECINFKSMISIDNVKYPFGNVYNYYTDNNMFKKQIELLSIANEYMIEYQLLLREIGLEKIRNELFINLPSRQKCIWLCKESQFPFWIKSIKGNYDIYKVRIHGNAFKSKNSLLPLPADSFNEILEKSKLYWSYDSDDENEDDEYLYVGKVELCEKIEF